MSTLEFKPGTTLDNSVLDTFGKKSAGPDADDKRRELVRLAKEKGIDHPEVKIKMAFLGRMIGKDTGEIRRDIEQDILANVKRSDLEPGATGKQDTALFDQKCDGCGSTIKSGEKMLRMADGVLCKKCVDGLENGSDAGPGESLDNSAHEFNWATVSMGQFETESGAEIAVKDRYMGQGYYRQIGKFVLWSPVQGLSEMSEAEVRNKLKEVLGNGEATKFRCSCGGHIEKTGEDEYECEDCGARFESDDWRPNERLKPMNNSLANSLTAPRTLEMRNAIDPDYKIGDIVDVHGEKGAIVKVNSDGSYAIRFHYGVVPRVNDDDIEGISSHIERGDY